jgi:uncharacterized protein HemY
MREAFMRFVMVCLVLTFSVILADRATAECQDDIEALQGKVAAKEGLIGKQEQTLPGTNSETSATTSTTAATTAAPTRGDLSAAKSWIAKAAKAEPTSEIECLNDLARARKALETSIRSSK